MKIDGVVLVIVAVICGVVTAGYVVALLIGVFVSGGLLLPVLAVVVAVIAVFVVVIRQRLANREDDHYEKIER